MTCVFETGLIRDRRLFKIEVFGNYQAKNLVDVLNYRTEYRIGT